MNTHNNRRRQDSRERMEKAFIELLQDREFSEIRVSEVCKRAGVNRTTFYANYPDLRGLADAIRDKLENNLTELYAEEIAAGRNSNDYLKLFRHIRDNQIFYRTYFKLGYDNQYRIFRYDRSLAERHFQNRFVEYHMEFFRSGLTRIIKLWMENGCRETPEEMMEILRSEYRGRETEFDP